MTRLAKKASEGVKVNLLLDGVGSLHTHRRFFKPLLHAGGRVDYFMPVLHRPFRGRANLRNHRKIAIADDETVMAGGTNIGAEYMGPEPNPRRWRDLAFVLKGPAVSHYIEIFRSDWAFASGAELPAQSPSASDTGRSNRGALVQIIPSGPDVSSDALHDAIVSMIFEARQRLWIVTPYFVPDETLTQSLVMAARRGIDLRVVLPARSNHRIPDIVRGGYLREIHEAGGKVLLYRDGMVHAKVTLMDDKVAVVGSANTDFRSMFLNYEVAMFLYSKSEIKQVADWTAELAGQCDAGVSSVSLARELTEGVVRILSPLV
jgi:cardiolipin synthase